MSKESEKGIVTLPINENTDDDLWGVGLHPVSGKKKNLVRLRVFKKVN